MEKHVEVVVVVAVVIVVVVVDRGKIARLDCFYFFFQQLLKIVVVVVSEWTDLKDSHLVEFDFSSNVEINNGANNAT